MATRCRLLALGFVLCCQARAFSPETGYSRRIWRSDDGLPQNKIQVVTQTSDGYLWVGTSGGLVRFDGVRFVVFDRSTTPALGDDSILALCPARDGSLWIGTEGGGLVHMKSGAFQSYGPSQGLANSFVRAIAEEDSGHILIGSDRGIFRLDPAAQGTGRLRRLDGHGQTPILAGQSMYRDRAGVTWLGTTRGLFRIVGDEIASPNPAWQSLGSVTAILETFIPNTGDGTLWLASESGLRTIIGGRLQQPLPSNPGSPRVLLTDHEGALWIGAGTGLTRRAGKEATTWRAPEALPDNTVLALFEDRELNLWIGTQDGLLRMTRSAVRTLSGKDGLAEDNVATISEDTAGRLWIGTVAGHLYSREGERLLPFAAPLGFRPRGIYVDREGTRWLSSVTQGLLRIIRDRPQDHPQNRPRIFDMKDGLRSNNVRQFLQDRHGAIWIATGSGLSRLEGDTLRTFYLEDGLAYGGVRVLAEDRNGDLLVGTDGGLNRIHEGAIVRDAVFEKLGNDRVWSIHTDSSGSLWLGTRGNGLVRIHDGRITRFTTRDGLMSNSIYQILDDGDRFWMSSPAGVFAADRKELDAVAEGRPGPIAVVPYTTDNGMLSSQMNGGVQSAGCRTHSGELWFPSVKGAVRIDPRQLRVPPAAPVLIEAVIADDKPVTLSSQIVIPPGRGKLEIDYTSPDLLSADHVTFRYRLEGFDEAWTPSPRSRAAYYTNLPAGRYAFHVVARDSARPDGVSEATLPILWRAHFYEAVWFYAVAALLAGLAILGVFRFYARQTKARYALVLAERTRLAREMHDTVIQGCVGVSTLLEAARSMPASSQAKTAELLERAATQVRLTVNEARDAVWDLRHSTIGQTEHAADQPTDVVQTLESFARQVEASEGIPVRSEFTGTPAPLGNTADRNLLLVAREAIRNAVTHAHAAGIHVTLRFDPAEVTLEVADNGRGFNVQAFRDNGHYGIIGMRERVEQSGGTFQVTSSPGHGTQVVARLPARKKT